MAEGTLRALGPRRLQPYVVDEAVLYRLRPGVTAEVQLPAIRGGGTVPFRVNAGGYRGPELAAAAARRVVVYGDSFVEERFTPEEATFVARLAAALSSAGAATEVVNAGVTGYGPDQCLLRMQRELPGLRPRVAVLALYAGNDFGDLVRDKLFRLDARGGLEPNAAQLDALQRRLVGGGPGLDSFAIVRALQALRRPSPPAGAAAGAPRPLASILADCAREQAELEREPTRVSNLFFDHYDADVAVQPLSASAEYKRRLMSAVVAAARDTAAAAGARLLVLAIPDWRDVCASCPQRTGLRAYPAYRPSALTDALAEIARAQGVPWVDLFPAFAARGDALYHPRDGHWNEEGQRLGAQLVAERLTAEGWLR